MNDLKRTHAEANAETWRKKRPLPSVPDYDCGIEGHLFTVLCDLDKVPRLAKCSACKKEWCFVKVMEIRRIDA